MTPMIAIIAGYLAGLGASLHTGHALVGIGRAIRSVASGDYKKAAGNVVGGLVAPPLVTVSTISDGIDELLSASKLLLSSPATPKVLPEA